MWMSEIFNPFWPGFLDPGNILGGDIGFVDLFYDFWIKKFVCQFLQFLDPDTAVFLRFLDPKTAPFLQFLDPEIFCSRFTISGSRNCSIFTVSGFRNCTISTISRCKHFFVHFYSFWIQKLHHFYDFWGPYGSWGNVCLAPAGDPMDRRAQINLT